MFQPHQVTILEVQKRKLQKTMKKRCKFGPVLLRLKNKEFGWGRYIIPYKKSTEEIGKGLTF